MDSTPPPVSPYPRPHLQGGGPSCPQCSSTQTKEIKYTWWGGVLAPKMMNLHKCEACRFQFNGKTGKSTKNAVLAYNLVAVLLAVVVFVAVKSALG